MATPGRYRNIFNDNLQSSDVDNDEIRLLHPKMNNTSNRNSLRGKPRKIWTYAFDWILVIGFIIAFVAIDKVHGHQREFSLADQTIMYTFAVKETVPSWLLVACAVVAPIGIILVWTLFIPPLGSVQRKRWRQGDLTWTEKLWDANLSLLGIGLAVASTITVTNLFKNLVGRPRPDFLDRCQPLVTATNPTIFSLSNSSVCTRTTLLKDGYRSFPSGHSSRSLLTCRVLIIVSFAGLGFLTLFIAGRLNVLDTRGHVWKTAITLTPLVAAGFIMVSRLMDNRHHPFDVIVGALIGLLFAWMAYRQYFPAISVAEGGRPHSIAEFAAEEGDRPTSYATSSGPERDLELGQTRHRAQRQGPATGGWDGMDTDAEEEQRPPQIKVQSSDHEYGTISTQYE